MEKLNMKNKDEVIKSINDIDSLADIKQTAYYLSSDISKFLSNELEELNIYSYAFRSGMERCLVRVLEALSKYEQSVVIFPESIPGFTMMVFKKNEFQKPKELKSKKNNDFLPQEFKVLDSVIGKFFEKNQQKVLLIENRDLLFALFPVSDAKKHLKAMDLYIVF